MKIRDDTWDIYKDYLGHAIDYFERFEKLDFEEATILNELTEIRNYYEGQESD
jgi:hypothetical protein